MLLFNYTTGKEGKLEKSLSLFDAAPLFEIDMPDCEKAPVFDFKNFPFEIFKDAPLRYKMGKTMDRVAYIDLACSFDIETTTIADAEKPFAFMYQWQYCIEDYVFMGKTWQEFQAFNEILQKTFDLKIYKDGDELKGRSLVCYIFNLSFEFTFMHAFLGDLVSPLFTDVYAPLIVPTAQGITYRCAYRLTNKSLEVFTRGFPHHKLKDDLDYSAIRTPIYNDVKNGLTDLELAYCYNDVKGLSEALRDRLEKDKYNIATIPLTSTGYVRKDCQHSMRKDPKCRAKFLDLRLDPHLFELCRMAFRGGNTHANAVYSRKTIGINNLGPVHHKDITSSYPRQIMCEGFPRTPFEKYEPAPDFLEKLRFLSKAWCFLIKFKIYDFEYIGSCGVPYIAQAKAFTRMQDEEEINLDNGRIFSAPVAMLCMTEIDMLILLKNYKYKKIEITECYRSRKGLLPYELRRVCIEYYKRKTILKGSEEGTLEAYEYNRSKEMLNSIYGMLCQRPDHLEFEFMDGEYKAVKKPLAEMLDKFYDSESSFLPYQYALWVTAHARKQLQDGCDIVGKDLLYIDTDSVFYVGDHEQQFELLNKKLRDEAIKRKAVAYKDEKEFPMGVWSDEGDLLYFKTLGAKKYIYSEDGKTIKATISGVAKDLGREFFTKHGFRAFNDNTVIPVSGKVSAHYNNEKPHIITINGVEIETASNIALVSASYTISLKDDYKKFIEYIHKSLASCYNQNKGG